MLKSNPEALPQEAAVRYAKAYRIAEWCERTRTSPATTWRRIQDKTLIVTRYGTIPYIVGGPAALAETDTQ